MKQNLTTIILAVTVLILVCINGAYSKIYELSPSEMRCILGKGCGPCKPATINCDGTYDGKTSSIILSTGKPEDSAGYCRNPAISLSGGPGVLGCSDDYCSGHNFPPKPRDGKCKNEIKSYCSLEPVKSMTPACTTTCGPTIAGICACLAYENPYAPTSYTVTYKDCKK